MRLFRLLVPLFAAATLGLVLGWFWDSPLPQAPTTVAINTTQNTELEKIINLPLIAVAPHHNLVAAQRQQFFSALAKQSQPTTIVLISPNHFNSGLSDVLTTSRVWDIQNGTATILPNLKVIQALQTADVATAHEAAFFPEHGIKNLLDDVHDFFPQAQLVPIMLKSSTSRAEVQALANTLESACAECGLIASVDMSHYQPAAVAEMHDVATIRALTDLNQDELWKVEVDSNASLSLLGLWAEAHSADRFSLFDHTNSGFLTNNLDTETTTHIFGNYTSGTPQTSERAFTFTVAGDAMFGRWVQNFQADYTQLFTQLGDRTFWGTDVSWLNLEGPVSDQPVKQITADDPLVFNFPSESIRALTFLKLTTAALANNHTYNQGQVGLDTTHHLVEEAGLDWVGDPRHISSDASVKRYQAGGIRTSLIAVSDFGDLTGLEDLIRSEKTQGQLVMIYAHWGLEYQPTHSLRQQQLATAWVNAGADLIIGAHPHVIQDAEIINHTPVFYSLGNFIFDQTFSVPTQQGLILTGKITDQEMKIVLTPIQSVDLKPQILKGDIKQQLIGQVCANLGAACDQGVVTVQRR